MENLRFTKNQLLKSVKQLFLMNEKLIKNQTEIVGLITVDHKQPTWRSTTLSCDKAIVITNDKTYVFADSVLCLGSICTSSSSGKQDQIVFGNSLSPRIESNRWRTGGIRVEMFPRFTTLDLLEKIQRLMTELRRFAHGHWSFLVSGSEKNLYGTHTYQPNGKRDRVAEDMMLNFSEGGHPVLRGSSALEREDSKSIGKEVSVHFCGGDDDTAELVLRTISHPPISSVSSEQQRTCATFWLAESLVVQKVQGNLLGNLPQKIPTSTTTTTRSGRRITAHLVLTFHTSRKSTRTCDNNSNASQKTKRRMSMRIR